MVTRSQSAPAGGLGAPTDAETEQQLRLGRVARVFRLAPDSPRLERALTHKSFAHEQPGALDNQRLEFLGDAVLGFWVSDALLSRFPDADEGQLTRTRAQVVSTGALARFARQCELAKVIRFGRGAAGGLSTSSKVLADAVEALIAACYLDGGAEAVQAVCVEILESGLEAVEAAGARDPKSELQERVQALGKPYPSYQVVGQRGPAHETEFTVEVSVGGEVLATGTGRSRRKAEAHAAEAALSIELAGLPDSFEPQPASSAGTPPDD